MNPQQSRLKGKVDLPLLAWTRKKPVLVQGLDQDHALIPEADQEVESALTPGRALAHAGVQDLVLVVDLDVADTLGLDLAHMEEDTPGRQCLIGVDT